MAEIVGILLFLIFFVICVDPLVYTSPLNPLDLIPQMSLQDFFLKVYAGKYGVDTTKWQELGWNILKWYTFKILQPLARINLHGFVGWIKMEINLKKRVRLTKE